MRTVLVTGAHGLIGRRVTPRLGGCRVHTVDRTDRPAEDHHVADLSHRDVVDDLLRSLAPSDILHLAGGPSPDPLQLYRNNVLTTVNLVQGAVAVGLRPYIIVVGSAAEYGTPNGGIVGDSTPKEPVTAYGRAKLAATMLARGLAETHDLPMGIARPFNVVAPDLPSSSALGNIRRQLLAHPGPDGAVPVRCGRLDVVRDLVPVDLVARALVAMLTQRTTGQVDVCTGVGLRLADVMEAMARSVGVAPEVIEDAALSGIPAPKRVIGDVRRMREIGVFETVDAAAIADVLLSGANAR